MEGIGISLISIIALVMIKMNLKSSYIISTIGVLALGSQRILPAFQLLFYSWSA